MNEFPTFYEPVEKMTKKHREAQACARRLRQIQEKRAKEDARKAKAAKEAR